MSQQAISIACARLGYELTRGTLAKIEAGIRAVSDLELFILANVLKENVSNLYPDGLLKEIRAGTITPFHVRADMKLDD